MVQYRDAVGIEITDTSAHLVYVRQRLGRQVRRSQWEVPLPEDSSEAAETLRREVSREGLAGLPAMVALNGRSVVFRSLRRERGDPRSVQQIVRMEAEHFDELSAYETVHDGYAIHIPRDGEQVFLAVARAQAAIRAVDVPARAGLQVVDVVPAPIGWFNSVAAVLPRDTADPYVLVRLGKDGTEVLVGVDTRLLFVRRLPLGSRGWESDPVQSPEEALADWIQEVRGCVELYRADLPKSASGPTRVFLAGWERHHPDAAAGLAEQLRLPTVRLEEELSPEAAADIRQFGTAAGLAGEGVRGRGVHLSLLPRELKQRMALRLQMKYWFLTGAAIVLCMSVLVLAQFWEWRQRDPDLRSRRLQVVRFQEAQESLADHAALNQALRARIDVLETSVRNAAVVRDVLQAVAAARDPYDWITVVADANSYLAASEGASRGDPLSAVTPGAAQPDRQISQIVVEGYTPWEDLSSVRHMIDELQAHPAVVEADLLGDDQLIVDEEEVSRWQKMDCRLFAIELSLAP